MQFSKMHGLGNDFVVFGARPEQLELCAESLQRLADRRRGIGCDQFLFLWAEDSGLHYAVRNADGSHAEQCGNGLRCLALQARRQGLTDADPMQLHGPRGVYRCRIQGEEVQTSLGVPELLSPVDHEGLRLERVQLGNPHAIARLAEIQSLDLEALARSVAALIGPINVSVLAPRDDGGIDLRVHERGAGETQACGSGAAAAASVAIRAGGHDTPLRVHLPGGSLAIEWQGVGKEIFVTGHAEHVFDGEL